MDNLKFQNHFGIGANPNSLEKPADFASMMQISDGFAANNLMKSNKIIETLGEYQKSKKNETELFEKIRKNLVGEYAKGLEARAKIAMNAKSSFHERLVWFWSNHFAVSADNIQMRALASSYEFEAIRPNIMGSFHQLMFAAITHPAMLIYLNQARSIGPNSKFAGFRAKNKNAEKIGINENLAREILELHTLGVHGGYTQKDVTEFAKAMTGLTIMNEQAKKRKFAPQNVELGQSYFEAGLHEPGQFEVLGEKYSGDNSVFMIFEKLAVHPSTALNIATKLARHFAGDNPPTSLVTRLRDKFLSTKGDLKALYSELLNAPECFDLNAKKFKNPWEWLISALRLSKDPKISEIDLPIVLRDLGMNVWQPGSPKGFDDIEDAWAAPNALVHRVETANIIASNFEFSLPPLQLAQKVLGNQLSSHTAQVISRAESQNVGYALLILSPEFLRR